MQSKKLRMRPYIWLFAVAICLTIVTNVFFADSSGEKTYLFRIVQISDSQPVPGQKEEFQRVTKVIERVNSLNPDLVLFPGDITFSGSEGEYIQLKAMLAKIEAPAHFVPGNHDTIWAADETEKVLSKTELRNKKIKL